MSSKVVVISGASRGLGQLLAEAYLKKNRVVGLSRTGSGPSGIENFKCDLRSSEEVQNCIDRVISQYEKIDILMNNAAVLKSSPLLLTKTQDIQDMVATNLTGLILLTKAALRPMISKKSGRIVNIISMSHRLKKPGDSVYAATKAAVEIFSQIVNQEVHSHGISVNCLGLSAMPSGMLAPLVKEDPDKIKRLIPHENYATLESVLLALETFCADGALDLGGQTLYLGGVSP